MEFHFRDPKGQSIPHEFEHFTYIPNLFETEPFKKRYIFNFNQRFIFTSMKNKSFFDKLFNYDQKVSSKTTTNLMTHALVMPLFLGTAMYKASNLLFAKTSFNNLNFMRMKNFLIFGLSFSIGLFNYFDIFNDRRLFMTGIKQFQ